MPQSKPNKVVYLFGAGATHAELTNLEPALIEEKLGLLIKNVSARVIEKARRKAEYLKDVKMVSATKGFLNIELLVSLIESSKIENWEHKTRYLKGLVRSDKSNLKLLNNFDRPSNPTILEEFQKYISQASVEPHSIKRRNQFLDKAFKHYLSPKTKGKIIGSN